MKTINNGQLRIKDVNKEVTLYGFVANKRKMGEVTFVDLRDRWGITQIVIHDMDVSFSKESVLEVKGTVIERSDKNKDLPTGEIEIKVKELKVISKANQLPFIVHDELQANEDTRLKHRYLDLRRPVMQQRIILRHRLTKAIRDYFDNHEFIEVETPYLSKSTPEGARDFLVPTRKEGRFFALPQSPQLYKQLLMIGGLERYFQIARCFRDEDSRKDRQPEFTQLDLEMSFVDEQDVMNMVEGLMVHLSKELKFKAEFPIQRMNYDEAMERFGSDKPDLRYGNEITDVKKYFENTKFTSFHNKDEIRMVHFEKVITNKEFRQLEEIAKKNGAKGVAYASFDPKTEVKEGPGFKFFEEELHAITKALKIEGGTLFFVADKKEVVLKSLGALRVELNNMFKIAPNVYKFVWIENWPLFEYDEERKGYAAAHHPFTSPAPESLDTFDKLPDQAKARAYDLVMNGFEIGGGSIRIFDTEVQSRMLRTIGFTEEQAKSQFGFFVEAFNYGVPPHGGCALGIDRMAMLFSGGESIRDVIAFPKNAQGYSVMEESPSEVTNEQLDEYFIKLKEKEKRD